MILDSLANSASVEGLHPLFKKAFDYVKNTDWSKTEPGKVLLQGDDLFISVAHIEGKSPDAAKMESHDAYIDIQIPLNQTEIMGWTPRSDCQHISQPYNGEKDITFYTDQPTAYIPVVPGQFAIFFPQDGHAPGIAKGEVIKLIVKVRL